MTVWGEGEKLRLQGPTDPKGTLFDKCSHDANWGITKSAGENSKRCFKVRWKAKGWGWRFFQKREKNILAEKRRKRKGRKRRVRLSNIKLGSRGFLRGSEKNSGTGGGEVRLGGLVLSIGEKPRENATCASGGTSAWGERQGTLSSREELRIGTGGGGGFQVSHTLYALKKKKRIGPNFMNGDDRD